MTCVIRNNFSVPRCALGAGGIQLFFSGNKQNKDKIRDEFLHPREGMSKISLLKKHIVIIRDRYICGQLVLRLLDNRCCAEGMECLLLCMV